MKDLDARKKIDAQREVDIQISNYLASNGNTYEPFYFSLKQKLEYAKKIKNLDIREEMIELANTALNRDK